MEEGVQAIIGALISLVILLPILLVLPLPWQFKTILLLCFLGYIVLEILGGIVRVPAVIYAKNIFPAIVAGIIVGVDIGILEASLGEYLGSWMWYFLVILALIFISLYVSGGPMAIYVPSLLILAFGYVMAGPYSGYVKNAIEGVLEPLGVGMQNLEEVWHDLSLIILNPQQYIAEQRMKQVKMEEPVSYPKGVELKSVNLLPSEGVVSGQIFFVQVRVGNERDDLKAEKIKVEAVCDSRYCREIEDEIYKRTKDELRPLEEFRNEFKFKAVASSDEDIGRSADVKVTVDYYYTASSNLLVTVMSEEEIERRIYNKELTFRTEVATGKPTPAMIALSVGEQPLYPSKEYPLIVSIVNKRGDAKIVLVPGTELNITVPKTIATSLNCTPSEEISLRCTNISLRSPAPGHPGYFRFNCTVTKKVEIEEFGYYPFVCVLNTTKSGDIGIEKTDIITATLSHYLVAMEETKGPTLQMGGEFVSDILSEEAFNKAKEVEEQSRHCDECGDWWICSKDECHSLGMCVFYDIPWRTNECRPCRYPMRCEDYPQPDRDGVKEASAKEECELDPCNIGNCTWDEKNKKCTSCSKTKCMQLNISLDSLTTEKRWVVLSDYVAPSQYETSLTKVKDEYFGYTEANPYEIDLRGKCSDNCYSYSEGEACMPWEVCVEEGNTFECCPTAACRPDLTYYVPETKTDWLPIKNLSGVANGACVYDGREIKACNVDSQFCSDEKRVPLWFMRELYNKEKEKYNLYERFSEISTPATCCERAICVNDIPYEFENIDTETINKAIAMNNFTVGEITANGKSYVRLISQRYRFDYLISRDALCSYAVAPSEKTFLEIGKGCSDTWGINWGCYAGKTKAMCCRKEICVNNNIMVINADKVRENDNCEEESYDLETECGTADECVEYYNGAAQCCAKWREGVKPNVCEGLDVVKSQEEGTCKYSEESRYAVICEEGETCVISPQTGEPECVAPQGGQE